MLIEFRISKDGSHTLFIPHLNETYHSLHGAIQESLYVFIEAGLEQVIGKGKEIVVLEIGFGTGLNALLTLMYACRKGKKISYHTLEPFPLPGDVFEKLNYIDLLNAPDLKKDFLAMHEAKNGELLQLGENFSFCRYMSSLETFTHEDLQADVVYFDAFAPAKQPEVWSLDNLQKVKRMMRTPGIFVTYCASGQFKRDLKQAGFEVETMQGPPGKKEMTRGIVS